MRRKELSNLILLVVLCALVAILNPQFLSAANIQNTSRLIGTYGIFSIGVGIVVITGGIDLSVGSMFALLGVLLSMMLTEWHWPASLTVLAILSLGSGMGFLHGTLLRNTFAQRDSRRLRDFWISRGSGIHSDCVLYKFGIAVVPWKLLRTVCDRRGSAGRLQPEGW